MSEPDAVTGHETNPKFHWAVEPLVENIKPRSDGFSEGQSTFLVVVWQCRMPRLGQYLAKIGRFPALENLLGREEVPVCVWGRLCLKPKCTFQNLTAICPIVLLNLRQHVLLVRIQA